MNRSTIKLATRGLVAGVALTATGLFAATPASAHTNNLYTYLDDVGVPAFATMDRATAAATPLPAAAVNFFDTLLGIEVHNEAGTAIGENDTDGPYSDFAAYSWDHSTGAEGAPVPLTVPGSDGLWAVTGLDSFTDEVVGDVYLTFVAYDVTEAQVTETLTAIAMLDPATGVLTPILDLTSLNFWSDAPDYVPYSLATDPIGGGTYLFLEGGDMIGPDTPYFLPLNPDDGTFGSVTQFGGAGFAAGYVLGADFDHDGTLYFIYDNEEREIYELSTIGSPSTWPTAARNYIGDAAANFGVNNLAVLALTLEYTPPALAATGVGMPVALLLAGGVAALAAGIVVVTSRRRAAV